MQPILSKYRFTINIRSRDGALDSSKIKEQILRKYYPKDFEYRILNKNDIPSFLDILNFRIKSIGLNAGLAIYIADYEEINGSLIATFTLLIETIVAYKDLRGFAKIVEEDLKLVLSSNNLITNISYDSIPIQSQNVERSNITINKWLLVIVFICLFAAIAYSIFQEHKGSLFPEKLEIMIHNETPSVIKTDNHSKDTSVIMLLTPSNQQSGRN